MNVVKIGPYSLIIIGALLCVLFIPRAEVGGWLCGLWRKKKKYFMLGMGQEFVFLIELELLEECNDQNQK